MATNTYVALDKITVSGTSTTSVTFSGISGAYTDLQLVINSQNQNSTYQPYIQFNSDTGTGTTNYSTTSMRGDGSSAASGRHTNNFGWYPVPGPGVGTTGNFQPWIVDIMGYSNTSIYKTGLSKFNNAASIVSRNTHLWRSYAAITSITITAESGAGYIAAGSTFSLYGIKAEGVSPAPKATGGAIYSDSTYYYHVFGSTGTFTPLSSLTADVLVVAGGGGGGMSNGGGGGAGGLVYSASQSLTATGYTVTVGGGGAGAPSATPAVGSAGTNSNLTGGVLSLTAAVGGGYGGYSGANGGTGGSGGGGGNGRTGGSATSGQGNAGGNGGANSAPYYSGGGGGGAGAVGTTGNSSVGGGDGGIGSSTYSVWSAATGIGQLVSGTYYIAAGGGGATDPGGYYGRGGSGGGGNAGTNGSSGNGVNAIANTGSGGGGATSNNSGTTGGAGGSGVVIVRYAK